MKGLYIMFGDRLNKQGTEWGPSYGMRISIRIPCISLIVIKAGTGCFKLKGVSNFHCQMLHYVYTAVGFTCSSLPSALRICTLERISIAADSVKIHLRNLEEKSLYSLPFRNRKTS
jgi:hypothetical protein